MHDADTRHTTASPSRAVAGDAVNALAVEQRKVDAAVTYVPRIIRNRFERSPLPLLTPVERVFQSAILFIDISGFTALNERLGKLGPG